MNSDKPLTFGSLFSGIGGFDLGFERAGMQCAWQVEIDASCQRILREHFSESVELFSDVREVGVNNLEAVDVICGGFPCQDVSVAGRREGLAGERSGLWVEFRRIIEEMLPKWVVVENVPGLLSSHSGRDFATVVRGLVECGYGVCWRVLDAQHFGVPQRRRRVFIVASLRSGSSAQVLFERESDTRNTSESKEAQAETTDVLGRSTAATLRGFGHGWQGQHNDTNAVVIKKVAAPIVSRIAKGCFTDPVNDNIILWQMNHASEVYRDNGSICPTLQERMGTGGNNVPLVGLRKLTPTECERLQGFPDGWTSSVSDSARYRQLGNAVAVPVAEWVAKRIVSVARLGAASSLA